MIFSHWHDLFKKAIDIVNRDSHQYSECCSSRLKNDTVHQLATIIYIIMRTAFAVSHEGLAERLALGSSQQIILRLHSLQRRNVSWDLSMGYELFSRFYKVRKRKNLKKFITVDLNE